MLFLDKDHRLIIVAKFTLNRERVVTLALHAGILTIGATTGVVSGESAPLVELTLTERDARSGGQSWPSHSSRGSST